jgi:hypothetical protein
VIAAYRVRGADWKELIIDDPSWPQTFYQTESEYDIREEDTLVGICTYHSNEDRVVRSGHGHESEMCNVYFMYYATNRSGAMEICAGYSNTQLEAIIPDKASVRPAFKHIEERTDSKCEL